MLDLEDPDSRLPRKRGSGMTPTHPRPTRVPSDEASSQGRTAPAWVVDPYCDPLLAHQQSGPKPNQYSQNHLTPPATSQTTDTLENLAKRLDRLNAVSQQAGLKKSPARTVSNQTAATLDTTGHSYSSRPWQRTASSSSYKPGEPTVEETRNERPDELSQERSQSQRDIKQGIKIYTRY